MRSSLPGASETASRHWPSSAARRSARISQLSTWQQTRRSRFAGPASPTGTPSSHPSVGALASRATAQRRANEELERRATTDKLTGLPNRLSLLALIDQAVTEYRATGPPLRSLCVTSTGCAGSMTCTATQWVTRSSKALPQHLRGLLRPGEVVGRFGGDMLVFVTSRRY